MDGTAESTWYYERLLIDWVRAIEDPANTSTLSHEAKLALAVQIFQQLVSLCANAGCEVARITAHDLLRNDLSSGLFKVEFVIGDVSGLYPHSGRSFMVPIYEDSDDQRIGSIAKSALNVPISETVTEKLDTPF